MYVKEVADIILKKFSGTEIVPTPERFNRDPEITVMIPSEKLKEICLYLRDDENMKFDLPIHMTAVDYIKDEKFELVYALYSTQRKNGVVLKTRIDRSKPEIDSVTDVWAGMDFQEREVFDLMGITFKNHPNLKKIMMWEGFPGFPLRKDYVHVTDKYDSGLEVGTPGLDAKGIPIKKEEGQ